MQAGTGVRRSAAARPTTRPTTSRPATIRARAPARVAAGTRGVTTSPEVLHDQHRDHEVGERDEPAPIDHPGPKRGVAAIECLVVLGRPEHPDDEEHHDHDLDQHEQRRRRRSTKSSASLARCRMSAKFPTSKSLDHRDPVCERDARGAPTRPASPRSRRSARATRTAVVAPAGRCRRRRVAAVVEAVAEAAARTAAEPGAVNVTAGSVAGRPGAGDLGTFRALVPDSSRCRPRSSAGSTSTPRSSRRGCAPGAPGASSRARTTCSATATPRASTSRSSSRRDGAPTTAATARRAARRAPVRAPASGPGSPRSTSSCSAAPATAEEPSGIYKDIVLARATDPVLAEVGQDGGLVSALLLYALEHDMIDAALVSYLEGDGTTWKAIPGVARTTRRRSSPRPGAATRTRRTRWRTPTRSRAAPSASPSWA